MGKFRVNYKLLREQGGYITETSKAFHACADHMMTTASQLDPRDARIQVIAKNLNEGAAALEQLSTMIKMAGQLLDSSAESYTKAESKSVKRVDSCRAHNRDFYKNPVVVASAGSGGGSGGGVAAGGPAGASAAAVAASSTNVNVSTATTVNVGTPVGMGTGPASSATRMAAAGPISGDAVAAGVGAGAAAIGGVAAATAVVGGIKAKKEKEAEEARKTAADDELSALETELEAAIARAKALTPSED